MSIMRHQRGFDTGTGQAELEALGCSFSQQLYDGVSELLAEVYPNHDIDALTQQVLATFWPEGSDPRDVPRHHDEGFWSVKDSYVITYGNTFVDGQHKPLDLLYDFTSMHLKGVVNGVHILPFFPYSSDDGFAVSDYYKVNHRLGDWADIRRIGGKFKLMSDLVLNHMSSQSRWFQEYLQGHSPYDKFFLDVPADTDTGEVVRPRAHPLLREVETANGVKHVWCTFSHDQVDFDFSNTDVLVEFIKIMRFHMDHGVRTIRLDAVAFLWKTLGTHCIHLPQTHQVIKLMRVLADYCEEELVLITETNVPNEENLSYFGNNDEAHMIYNFSLPPLVLHGLLNGTSKALNSWAKSMPATEPGAAYFNFTASHDGIGMRPAEGLLSDGEIFSIIDSVKRFGGMVSMRETKDGVKPYEINTSLFDALKGTVKGEDQYNVERFLCSQTIAMSLAGVPAVYVQSLFGTHNDLQAVEKTGRNRTINRHRWNYPQLLLELKNEKSVHARVFDQMKRLLLVRTAQPAFHPNASQEILDCGDAQFVVKRVSLDGMQTIIAVHNMADKKVAIDTHLLGIEAGQEFTQLLDGDIAANCDGSLTLQPYQCCWLTN